MKRISFITSMAAYPWGGSEELWQRTAICLKKENYDISVHYQKGRGWHAKMDELVDTGIAVHSYGFRNARLNGWSGAIRASLTGCNIASPWPAAGDWMHSDLAVVSQGGISDGLNWLDTLRVNKVPYVIIVQANAVATWPNDTQAELLRQNYEAAKKVFFVSDDNLRLFRTQVGYTANNLEVVWNPLNSFTPIEPLPWPCRDDAKLMIAMVGRIEPFAKGQDIALEAFASPLIRDLPIHLSIYGHGPWHQTCQRLIENWNLDNVCMRGYATPSEIWNEHHALLLPSRHEGMSLAMLESLWLGRPVLATHVAGAISEIVDGVNGFFISNLSAHGVTQTILNAWHSKSELMTYGRAAAERIRERMPHDPAKKLAHEIQKHIS